jgi:ribonuclease III
MDPTPTSSIEAQLKYTFADRGLFEEALRHSSYVNEAPETGLRDNERLEFLGDAVLNLVVGHILLTRFPMFKEGDLSRMRASLVNEQQLARLARTLNLGAFVRLGKGESQTGGQEKNSILAGTLEAVSTLIQKHFLPLVQELDGAYEHADFKSQLQEFVQARPGSMPHYAILRQEGPDHDKTFWVELKVLNVETLGIGKSKKTAEQDAARKALALIKP